MTAGPATVATASVKLLRKGAAYPDRPESVELIETEFSWVFLTDRFAYKLKKPVRFEFLDYSSSEQRHRASQEELHVNQCLAPDIYLAVLPITRSARGRLQLNGVGSPVDWVLKMRRLPGERSLRKPADPPSADLAGPGRSCPATRTPLQPTTTADRSTGQLSASSCTAGPQQSKRPAGPSSIPRDVDPTDPWRTAARSGAAVATVRPAGLRRACPGRPRRPATGSHLCSDAAGCD